MNGVLIIDKPAGWTSHDVVARVRRILRERRVGHTGTLDPFATGVLVILVGRATRLAQFLAGAEKEYEALVRFGYATETGDLTGARRELTPPETLPDSLTESPTFAGAKETTRARPCAEWNAAEIERALASLRGEVEQVPPMYSAKKVQGQKLYELARRGLEIERKAVSVSIRELELLESGGVSSWRANEDDTCDLALRVVCSAGTYIRVLAEDLGARLGAGAHLVALRRTRAGAFALAQSVTLEHLAGQVEAGALAGLLIAPDAALPEMPFVSLAPDEAARARHGAAVPVAEDFDTPGGGGALVKMRDEAGELIAVGVYDAARRRVQPRVMIDAGADK